MAYAIPICLRSDSFKRYSQINSTFYSFHRVIKVRSPSKISLCRHCRHYASAIGGPTPGQLEPQGEDAEEDMQNERNFNRSSRNSTLFKMLESAATTLASILVLGLAGYGYHRVSSFSEQGFCSGLLVQELKAIEAGLSYRVVRIYTLRKQTDSKNGRSIISPWFLRK